MGAKRIALMAGAFLGIMALGALLVSTLFQPTAVEPTRTLRLAAGGEGGAYYLFGDSLRELADFDVEVLSTGGSVDNLSLLRQGEADFAIVQNDIAQYTKLGIRGQEQYSDITYVVPLFPEYVQVLVPQESPITVLGQLQGQQVCVGPVGSGSSFNSLDILEEAGLRAAIDYEVVNLTANECMDAIDEGAPISAIIITSNKRYADEDPNFRQISFSDAMAASLAEQYPYFRVIDPSEEGGFLYPELAVDAYLATDINAPEVNVRLLADSVLTHWDNYRERMPGLPVMQLSDDRETIPFHSAASSSLEKSGLRVPSLLAWLVLLPWLALLVISMAVERWKYAYDRMGGNPFAGSWHEIPIRLLGFVSRPIILLSTLVGVIWLAVLGLRFVEDLYATARGEISPFAMMTFEDNLVWLFTYVSSGFTTEGIYPESLFGRMILVVLAMVGLVAPLTFGVYIINAANTKKLRALQGLGEARFRNHVLICGWNEKAPGIIYTLTGKDVKIPKNVVLIAELSEQFPLETYGFEPKRVQYCRGSGSEMKTLERANIQHADAAIILAEYGGNSNHNKKSLLTSLAINNINDSIYICAEVEYDDNADYFASAGANALVRTDLVIRRLASATILSQHIADYLMDAVTYHEDELYSISVSDLAVRFGKHSFSLEEVRKDRLRVGVNVVGSGNLSVKESLFDSRFSNDATNGTPLGMEVRNSLLGPEDVLIYSAGNRNDIFRSASGAEPGVPEAAHFGIEIDDEMHIVVCSDQGTIAAIEGELRSVMPGVVLVGIDIEKGIPRNQSQLIEKLPERIDRVLLLGASEHRANFNSIDDVNEFDSDLILLTRLFKTMKNRREAIGKSGEWYIISEVANIKNRDLMRSAGADYALPTVTFAERLMSKEVYDKSHVTNFLMAAMNVMDGVHLHCHIVTEGDGFCGEPFESILATSIEGARLLGWRPLDADLRNRQGDFDFHYRTVAGKRDGNQVAKAGDILILLAERRTHYPRMDGLPN